ncbi:MAG: VanZ family protein [Lachnospiraceae bacterium]|nr:VanZ family protein [Lachnospiraceae bacterium]
MIEIIRRDKAGKWSNIAGTLALIWMCVIFAFSAQTKEESSVVSEGFSYRIVNTTGLFFHLNLDEEQLREIAAAIEYFVRKGAHMTEYAILAVLLYIWTSRWELTRLRRSLTAAVATMLYAGSDEFHQLFVAGRSGRISDVLIDSAGAVIGLVFFLLAESIVEALRKRRQARKATRK